MPTPLPGLQPIVTALTAKRLIPPEAATAAAAQTFESLGDALEWLQDEYHIEESALYTITAAAVRFPYSELRGRRISQSVLALVPVTVAEHHQLVPFAFEKGVLSVGMVDPYNVQGIEAIEFLARQKKFKIQYHLISPGSYRDGVAQYGGAASEVKEALQAVAAEQAEGERGVSRPATRRQSSTEIQEVLSQAPVAKIVSVIMKYGVDNRASDIHIEPLDEGSRVRYRIDGVLQTLLTLPSYVHASLISRVKVLASLKLDETRIPQDGRITLTVDDEEVDFRVSTMPVGDREKAVLRILPNSETVPTLDDLGFHKFHIEQLREQVQRPHGLFLISGPTGSGKSTTLYSLLNMLNTDTANIATLEDPIEFQLRGVNQSQIAPDVGFSFASGLRSLLRQDPNVIMVGEIRDGETAEMSIHAGLTGHLIFSTIHTNDAFGVVPRLIDMKVEPFLLASTLNVVVAQRLTRKICEHCRETVPVPDYIQQTVQRELGLIDQKLIPSGIPAGAAVFYHGKGCERCGQTGYHGRLAIAEVLVVTQELQKLIVSGYDASAVRAEMKRQQMVTLMQDGILRALEGLTTIDEVLRVTEE